MKQMTDNELIRRYRSGATLQALSRLCRYSASGVGKRLKRRGEKLRRRGYRKYTLNEHFFDKIETEAQAYWLGFILADGCVHQFGRRRRIGKGNWVCSISLASIDKAHLEKLNFAAASTARIHSKWRTGTVTLNLCSGPLCQALIRLGCIPKKSCIHGTPPVSEHLQHHFYRGFFDGDGSLVSLPKYHNWSFSVVGSPRFIAEYQQWLCERAAVSRTKLVVKGPVTALSYMGGKQVARIMRVLYEGATIWLERKHVRYLSLLSRGQRKTAA